MSNTETNPTATDLAEILGYTDLGADELQAIIDETEDSWAPTGEIEVEAARAELARREVA